MRLLFLPNERILNDNPGPRHAFLKLFERGELEAVEAYSYIVRGRELGSASESWAEFERIFRDFRPNAVYIQHVANFPVASSRLEALKREFPDVVWVYEDKDPYDNFYKKVTPSMASLCALADLIFVNGDSPEYFSLFSRYGCRDIHYISDFYYAPQFAGSEDPPAVDLSGCDVVMIGSRMRPWYSRIPGLGRLQFEGSFNRELLVKKLQKKFGRRFAILGAGWRGFPSWRGQLPFAQQGNVIRMVPINVIWDRMNSVPLYSSNRLPISLGSGGVHVRSYIPGIERYAANGNAFFWVKDVDSLIDRVEKVLAMPAAERERVAANGRQLAAESFDPVNIYSAVMKIVRGKREHSKG